MQAVATQSRTNKNISTIVWLLLIGMALLIIAAISVPNLLRSRIAADQAYSINARMAPASGLVVSKQEVAVAERQVIRTAEMSLLVDDAAKRMEEVSAIAARFGGFVESSQVWRAEGGGSAQITLRVPAVALEETKLALRHIAKKVDSEKTNATDLTAQAIDLNATLRNYRAEEQQYLGIMQRAGTVEDTLAVAQRLSDVRGRIERTQAQLTLMSRQVEMATVTITLHVAPITQVRWLPNFRESWNAAAESMASYLASMTALALYVPVILAWFFTIVALLAVVWRVLRWIWQRWFAVPQVARA